MVLQQLSSDGLRVELLNGNGLRAPVTASAFRVAVGAAETGILHRAARAMRADGLDVCVATTDSRELVVESWHVGVDAVVCFLPDARTQVAAVRHLHDRLPRAHIVMVGPPSSRLRLRRLLHAGADAIVLDSQMDVALATAVSAACIGQVSLPRDFMGSVERPPLTSRQKEILRRVVQGKGNAEIAHELYLAESTVKGHLSEAFARLGVRSRAEAAALVLDPDAGRGLGIMEISR